MNRQPQTHSDFEPIDRILAGEDELVPSSGFSAAVMDRVRQEAAAPPPIPFPWKLALPGILLALAVLGWGVYALIRYALQSTANFSFALPHLNLRADHALQSTGWVVLALVVALASSWLANRMVQRSGAL
jgi:hypothetical protein